MRAATCRAWQSVRDLRRAEMREAALNHNNHGFCAPGNFKTVCKTSTDWCCQLRHQGGAAEHRICGEDDTERFGEGDTERTRRLLFTLTNQSTGPLGNMLL